MMMTRDVHWTNVIMVYNKNRTHDTLAGGLQERKRYIRGKLKRNNSSTITTHTYMSKTENSEMMDHDKQWDKKGMNTSSIVDRVHYVLQF